MNLLLLECVYYLTLTYNEKIVGYSVGKINVEHPFLKIKPSVYLDDLYVKEEYRGKSLGDRFMEETLKWAIKAGAKKATSHVAENNIYCLSIFEKTDFKIEGYYLSKELLVGEVIE